MNVAENYTADKLSIRTTVLAMFATGLGSALFTLACWLVLKTTNLPAFGGSYVSRALSTAGSIMVLVAVGALVFFWLRDAHKGAKPPRWRVLLTYLVTYLSPAAIVVTSIGLPLSATRLYLDGVTIDQGFRTQFLTRLAAEPGLPDMNYEGMPSFYPGGWFWLGARLANLLGLPGWAAYQPWALVSIGAVACVLVPLWQRLTGSLPIAVTIALVSIAIFLVMSPEEPYAGIVALGIPAAAVLMSRTLDNSWPAAAALAVYLGLSAATYTIFTAAIAMSVVVIALMYALLIERSFQPVLKLAVVGISSSLIALVVWGPYLWQILRGAPISNSSATHYLPWEGTQLPLPFFSFTLIGLLCLIGLGFLVFRFQDHDVRSLGITLVIVYGWIVASMVFTLSGNTLLGFRLDILVTLILATAGVLGIADLRLNGLSRVWPEQLSARARIQISAAMAVILFAAGVSYVQRIPNHARVAIDLAYTDTDGYGDRADRFPADSAKYFAEIDSFIQSEGYQPTSTVVLTDVKDFMSFYPYYGFQAFTGHYANPLGRFEERNKLIEEWATRSHTDLKDPQRFQAELQKAPWRSPDVFILHGDASDPKSTWKYDLAEDIYPNNPNVRFRGVFFNPAVFEGWHVKQIGPLVVVVKPVT